MARYERGIADGLCSRRMGFSEYRLINLVRNCRYLKATATARL
jgi:hypothetical protein